MLHTTKYGRKYHIQAYVLPWGIRQHFFTTDILVLPLTSQKMSFYQNVCVCVYVVSMCVCISMVSMSVCDCMVNMSVCLYGQNGLSVCLFFVVSMCVCLFVCVMLIHRLMTNLYQYRLTL